MDEENKNVIHTITEEFEEIVVKVKAPLKRVITGLVMIWGGITFAISNFFSDKALDFVAQVMGSIPMFNGIVRQEWTQWVGQACFVISIIAAGYKVKKSKEVVVKTTVVKETVEEKKE